MKSERPRSLASVSRRPMFAAPTCALTAHWHDDAPCLQYNSSRLKPAYSAPAVLAPDGSWDFGPAMNEDASRGTDTVCHSQMRNAAGNDCKVGASPEKALALRLDDNGEGVCEAARQMGNSCSDTGTDADMAAALSRASVSHAGSQARQSCGGRIVPVKLSVGCSSSDHANTTAVQPRNISIRSGASIAKAQGHGCIHASAGHQSTHGCIRGHRSTHTALPSQPTTSVVPLVVAPVLARMLSVHQDKQVRALSVPGNGGWNVRRHLRVVDARLTCALTRYCVPTRFRLQVQKAIAQLKLAFDNLEKQRPALSRDLLTQMFELVVRAVPLSALLPLPPVAKDLLHRSCCSRAVSPSSVTNSISLPCTGWQVCSTNPSVASIMPPSVAALVSAPGAELVPLPHKPPPPGWPPQAEDAATRSCCSWGESS